MNIDASSGLQLLLLGCTVAASYGVARSQIKRLLEDLGTTAAGLDVAGRRLDQIEQHQKVLEHQVNVLAKILSPDALKESHREISAITTRLEILERQIASLSGMHNGSHKYIPPPG